MAAGSAAMNASTSAWVDVWPSVSAQRTSRVALRDAHGEQHVARLRHAGLARRARRARDAGCVEEVEQGVTVAAGHEQVHVAREPARSVAALPHPGRPDVGRDRHGPVDEVVAQGHEARRLGVHRRRRLDEGRGETDDGRGVEGAGADLALLPAAVGERDERWHRAGRRGRRRPIGPPSLCAVTDMRSAPLRGEVDGHVAGGLHGVGVQGHPELVGHVGERADVLHRADLVVGPHHRHEGDGVGVGLDRGAHRRGLDDPLGRALEPGDLGTLVGDEEVDAVEDGVVLGRADEQAHAGGVAVAARPVGALDREVVGLRAARGEDDLGGTGAEAAGDLLARLLDGASGGSTGAVQGGGVAHDRELLRHRREGGREHRRRRRVVEVGSHPTILGRRRAPPGPLRARPRGRCRRPPPWGLPVL